jgi:hypothetical protein
MSADEVMSPAQVIIAALRLKRERVVFGDYANKLQARGRLDDLIIRAGLAYRGEKCPSAAELREALGDAAHEDRQLREALDAWEAAP